MRTVFKASLWAVCAAFVVLMTPPAYAAPQMNFDFSMTDTTGNVSGTVTGEIFGLTANTTSSASSVEVFSWPAGMANPDSVTTPLTLTGTPVDNSFTISSGALTAANYEISSADSNVQLRLDVGGTGSGPNAFTLNNFTNEVQSGNGFSGVTYTPAPEPGSVAICLVGAAILLTFRVRKHKNNGLGTAGPAV